MMRLFQSDTKITDAGLVHLEGLTILQNLQLDNTKVTDAGLVHLKGLSKLRLLGLKNTKVSKVGVQKLQKALPDCDIDWDETIELLGKAKISP